MGGNLKCVDAIASSAPDHHKKFPSIKKTLVTRARSTRNQPARKTPSLDERFRSVMTWDAWLRDYVPPELHPYHLRIQPRRRRAAWSDPMFQQQHPWQAILSYVNDVLISLGKPFVAVRRLGDGSWVANPVWGRRPSSRYQRPYSSHEQWLARVAEREAQWSRPALRRLYPFIEEWALDLQYASDAAVFTIASVEGCIVCLKKEVGARRALQRALGNLRHPLPTEDVQRIVAEDCRQAITILTEAIQRAQAAQKMLAPVMRYFFSKHSPAFKKDRDRLIGLLVARGKVSQREASNLVAELLPTINRNFTRKREAIRVSASSPSQSML